ncbi:hypothetical protein BOX15_Mlig002134g1 [Macrostomum lignano]|uniref:Uncharacterized protein n=1 Tax=Macrostomum lignano TaxID=282301 RepID=A0A267H2R5_9PLAT|nr:hypothetical protein BOX15_Mlig002134g1 [Macrostomum lignano]
MDEPPSDEGRQRLEKCLTILSKNVPVTDQLLEQLEESQLISQQNGVKSRVAAAPLTRRQSDPNLFVSMATLEPDRLHQLAHCLRIAGHPLMAELLLQTVTSWDSKDPSAAEHTNSLLFGTSNRLPQSVADRLVDSPEAQSDLAEFLSERRLLTWCRESLFDPAGADVMSLRRQHAEESWRAARDVREKTAAMAELQAELTQAQAAVTERDQTIAQLESRLSTLAAAAGAADDVGELRSQLEVSRRHQAASESQAQRATARLEAYSAAFDFVLAEARQFQAEAADQVPSILTDGDATEGGFVENLRQELDDSHRLASFQSEFAGRFLATCRALLEERRQVVQLAERLASSTDGGSGDFDPQQPLAEELSRLVAGQAEENAMLTARHRLLLKVLEGGSVQPTTSDSNDELVAAVESLRRQLAERDRRIASLTTRPAESPAAALSPPPQPPQRSAAVTRAWDEVAPPPDSGSTSEMKRYSVLPEIQSASSSNSRGRSGQTPSVIPHSHRKATKREGNVKKREPPGKPMPANVVSLS